MSEQTLRGAQQTLRMLDQMDQAGFVGCYEERAAIRKRAEAAMRERLEAGAKEQP